MPNSRIEQVALMQADLINEHTHMLFYLSSSATIQGLHRAELGEWLEEEAMSEMSHVKEFSKLLVSLGEEPVVDFHDFERLSCPDDIVDKAIDLEQEVCVAYAKRIGEAECLSSRSAGEERAAWKRVSLFYEDQLNHSHHDLDELRRWR